MVTISEKKMDFKSNLKINFNGGDLTSDSGMLLFKEFDSQIGFSQVIKDSLNFNNDDVDHSLHENEDVVLHGYHPLLMFDGVTGELIKAELRAGNVYTSRRAVRFIGPVFKEYRKKFKEIQLHLRADSGFATPGIYRIAEEHNISYTIRLKANAKLYDLAKPFLKKLNQNSEISKKQVIYGEFNYQAGSWDKNRKVIVKIEKPAEGCPNK
ncbi:transposase [Halanaerobium congolense]|uniref:DDE family transposase n=1 Tax=Halanaerobium congolense TaxID=54121 RepID=A0A4R7EFA7_9FIRM|nr:transposase [Halanaerobium congolense]TDS32223.1 DDE family transposase [Halanaerobium congolense]